MRCWHYDGCDPNGEDVHRSVLRAGRRIDRKHECKTSFDGALADGVVNGVLVFSVAGSGTIGVTSIVQSYSSTMSVALH